MTFQAVPDGVEVVFEAIQNGVPIVNVYHVKDTATLDAARLQVIIDVFVNWWRSGPAAILSNSYVLQTVKATAMELASGPQVINTLTTSNQGALTGEQVAGNAALVISWRTANIGRSYRGRTYIGGLDAASTDTAQVVSSAFAAAWAGHAQDLIDDLAAIGAVLSVLSRVSNLVLRAVGILTEIISIVVDTKIDSQRRRTAN